MKLGPTSALCIFAVLGISSAVQRSTAQASTSPAPNSIGPQAVKMILKHFAINPLASDPATHQPLRTDGSWSLGKARPASCPQSGTCVEVFYDVPAQSAKCSWVVSLNQDATDGAILDENPDADAYMVRMLTATEAAQLIKSRSTPVWAPIAKAANVSGVVVLSVLVDKSGELQRSRPVSGPPMLIPSCMDAVKKWSFMPMSLGPRTVPYQVQLVFTFNSLTGKVKAEP